MRAGFLLLCAFVLWPVASRAGNGPAGVIVVVNTRSWASLSIANAYIQARAIPRSHVVALDLPLARRDHIMDVDAFRESVLKPVLAAIAERGLDPWIDGVAYSADIPVAIDFTCDFRQGTNAESSAVVGSLASINGLTFLHEMVLARQPYWKLDANRYYRPFAPITNGVAGGEVLFDVAPSVGLKPWRASVSNAPRYLLAAVLAVTSGRGNSVAEAVAGLQRAANADGTHPRGTFYFMHDGGIRTETRRPWFRSAIVKLRGMGQRAEQANYTIPAVYADLIGLPTNRDDIVGAMLGQQVPRPDRSGSRTLPGAIVENLTSEGGIMGWEGWQAPISTFIRFGVAGTAGVVAEPYAIWQKFPTPFLFVHYASGCSLAEAFYQSISGPYQLLVLGDPLCRPFATPRTAIVDGPASGEILAQPLAAGSLTKVGDRPVALGQPVRVRAAVPGARRIDIWHCGRVVATVAGEAGEMEIPALSLGAGPVRLDAVGAVGSQQVWVAPLRLDVAAPPLLPAVRPPLREGEERLDGPILTTPGTNGLWIVDDMRRRQALQEAKIPAGQAYKIESWFDVPADDLCQFQVWSDGPVTLQVDGAVLPEADGKGWTFLPVALARGAHHMVASGRAGPDRELEIRFGPPGTRSIGRRTHATEPGHLSMHFGHIGKRPALPEGRATP